MNMLEIRYSLVTIYEDLLDTHKKYIEKKILYIYYC